MKRIFNELSPIKVSFWNRIRLYFKPILTSYDYGSDDLSILVYYKILDGIIYIIKVEEIA